MKWRFLKESFVERLLVLSNRIIKTRSHQKIKHTIVSKRFPQRKAENGVYTYFGFTITFRSILSSTQLLKDFLNTKLKMAQKLEGTCQLKVMYTLKLMKIKTVEKHCTQFLKATHSDCGIFLVKSPENGCLSLSVCC